MTSEEVSRLRCKLREGHQESRKAWREQLLRDKRVRLDQEAVLQEEVSPERFKELLEQLKKKCNHSILQQIKKAVTQGDAFIEEFVKFSGAIYALVGQLTSQNPENQLEAAKCITNLCLGPHKSTFRILKASSAYLILFLHSSNYLLQDQCAWALGNMVADCSKCCEHLKVQGIITGLTHALKSPQADVVFSAAFALQCYTLHENSGYSDTEKDVLVETLCQLYGSWWQLKPEVRPHITFAAFHLSANISEWYHVFYTSNFALLSFDLLAQYCNKEQMDIAVITPLVRCLANCVSGVSHISSAISCKIASHPRFAMTFSDLLVSKFHHLQKETLWFLHNLVESDDTLLKNTQVQGVVQKLATLLASARHEQGDNEASETDDGMSLIVHHLQTKLNE